MIDVAAMNEGRITDFNNDADQATRRRTLENDRKVRSTYFEHVKSDPDLELGGRFKKLTPTSVTGAGPSPIPRQPAGSFWANDPVPPEMPLGIDINAQEPVGELHEQRASTGTVEEGPAAAAFSHVNVAAGPTSKRFRRRA